MGKIFLVLAIGFLIGYKGILKEKGIRINSKLQTVWLLLLIFCMGVSIGRNGEIIRNLPLLGGKAILFAIMGALGSTVVVYVVSVLFLEKGGEEMSLAILVTLILGIGAGIYMPEDFSAFLDSASSGMLLILLFSVGIDMGLNKEVFTRIRELGFKILLIPCGVVLGSLCGGAVTALLVHLPLKEGLAISSGLGWYSLSGILMTEAGNPVGGTISFLANVFREMLTFICVPFLAGHLNGYCAIAPAGATAMDTTLGIISKNTNATIAVLAFVSGVLCTLIVPVLVPLFL